MRSSGVSEGICLVKSVSLRAFKTLCSSFSLCSDLHLLSSFSSIGASSSLDLRSSNLGHLENAPLFVVDMNSIHIARGIPSPYSLGIPSCSFHPRVSRVLITDCHALYHCPRLTINLTLSFQVSRLSLKPCAFICSNNLSAVLNEAFRIATDNKRLYDRVERKTLQWR